MQERIRKNNFSRNYLDVAIKTKSWQPVFKNGWEIKFSIYQENFILLFFHSKHTGQLFVRQFTDEDCACDYVNFIVELDSTQFHNA
jgi:hypothetical protein